jgi:hypothetical protein
MKAYLQRIVRTLDLGDPKDSKVGEINETTMATDVKLFGINATNTTIGVDMIYSAAAFAPKKGAYFALLGVETVAGHKAHENMMGEILNSITPIAGGNAD